MKIYNKKKFYSGIVFLILAVLNLSILFFKGIYVKGIILTVILSYASFVDLYRSMSNKYSREYILNENDERSRLIDLKTRAKCYDIISKTLLILGLIFTIFGATKGQIGYVFVGIGITLSMLWVISLLIELFTNMHCNSYGIMVHF